MTRDQVIAKLRDHEPALHKGGIVHLRLFGSKARGDDSPGSDIDLMADFDTARRFSLFEKAGLEVELAELLHTHVDLSDRALLKDQVRASAEREAILVF